MANRAYHLALLFSAAALVATFWLGVASIWLDPWNHRISLSDKFHIGFWEGRIVIFNDAEYGPYRGSIIALVDDQGNEFPRDLKKTLFGDTAGIYYRHFVWTDSGAELWTLMMSLLYPLGLFAILPGWFAIQMIWNREGHTGPV